MAKDSLLKCNHRFTALYACPADRAAEIVPMASCDDSFKFDGRRQAFPRFYIPGCPFKMS